MSTVLDDTLLDDPDRLTVADGAAGGCLRWTASAGAQVRATVDAAAEVDVASFAESRPRALVLLSRPGVGPAVNRLLLALLGPACPVPVVVSEAVPSWVGALDVVLAHTEDPGDVVLAESVDRAARRGASVVLTAPGQGPVAAAAARGTLLLTERVSVPAGFAFPRALAAGLLLLDALGLLRTDFDVLADELDREAEKDHASYESFVNPAKALALRLADRTPLLCGLDRVATAVGRYAVDALGAFAGVVGSADDYAQVATRPVLHRSAVRATSGGDIFADPDDDEAGLLRVLLLAVADVPELDGTRRTALDMLSGADLLAPADETAGGTVVRAAVLALRFEMTAVYLGLSTGVLGGGRYLPLAG